MQACNQQSTALKHVNPGRGRGRSLHGVMQSNLTILSERTASAQFYKYLKVATDEYNYRHLSV